MTKLRVLAVDDEALALRQLAVLLARIPDIDLIGTAPGGREALDAIADLRPDVVLLDIRMSDFGGFDVINALSGPHVPLVIFVTAFDRYAVRAFEVRAVDYVLKPVEPDRLAAALARARRSLSASDVERRIADMRQVLAALRDECAAVETKNFETEIWAQGHGANIRISVSDLDWLEAERDYVHLHAGGRSYLLRDTLTGLQTRLDPGQFIRVRRSALVQLDRITGIRRAGPGDMRVMLTSGEDVRVGRTYIAEIRAMILSRKGQAARSERP